MGKRDFWRIIDIKGNDVTKKVRVGDSIYSEPIGKYDRVTINIPQKLRINEVEVSGKKELWVDVDKIKAIPNVCVYVKDEKTNKIVCLDNVKEERDKYILSDKVEKAVGVLSEISKVRPDIIDFLVNNNISIIWDKTMKPEGIANCENGYIKLKYGLDERKLIETLLHEFAHCKEQIVRKEKRLPRMYAEWRREDGKLIPIGGEERAESFAERLKRLIF